MQSPKSRLQAAFAAFLIPIPGDFPPAEAFRVRSDALLEEEQRQSDVALQLEVALCRDIVVVFQHMCCRQGEHRRTIVSHGYQNAAMR